MGGFAGGDEGGYWDIDTLTSSIDKQNTDKSKSSNRKKSDIETTDTGYRIKAYAKATTIDHTDEGLPQLSCLYDTISFVYCKCDTFTIEGCDNIPLESNTIYKAFHVLNNFTNDLDILDFFYEHKVVVTKRIPLSVGLGGSSSDAAAFMLLVKEVCNLVLSTDELTKIGSAIAPDVPCFLSKYP